MSAGDALDPLLSAVREEVRARADAGGRVRDFAAMIARAHGLDPAAVPDEAVAEAAQFAPVVALRVVSSVPEDRGARARRRRGSGAIAVACAAVLLAAGILGATRMARDESSSPSAHAVPLVGPLAAAAEASGAARPTAGTSTGQGAPPGSGPRSEAPGGPAGAGGEDTPGPDADAGAGAPAGGDAGDDECLFEQVQSDISTGNCESAGEAGAAPASVTIGARGEVAPAPRPDGRGSNVRRGSSGSPARVEGPRDVGSGAQATGEAAWEALDRAAREAWRRGDVVEARALLTALVRSDATASRVELAYGDLFVLTRRADDAGELARLWRAYLARFPRGLYAEDARAGLCRRAAGAERRTCWELYLETWPEGAHAGEAREAM